MNLERTVLSTLLWPVHRRLLRSSSSRGLAEPSDKGVGTLALTTVGRRSGEKRRVPVFFIRDGGRMAMVASNAGDDAHPNWYLNLQAAPSVEVQTPAGGNQHATARDATEAEHTRLWPELVRRNPGYARYEMRTERHLPIVILEPT